MTSITDIDLLLERLLTTIRACSGRVAPHDVGDCRTHDERVNLIDSMLDKLVESSEELKRVRARTVFQRNCASSKITELPEEVLLSVFELATRVAEEPTSQGLFGGHANSNPGFTRHPCYTAFAISWTCSYWRKISLDYAGMWTHIDLAYLPSHIAKEMFIRAKDHPLTVSCKKLDNHTISRVAKDYLPSRLSRIRVLSLGTAPEEALSEALLSSPAEHMERFTFCPQSYSSSRGIVSAPLFAGSADKLQHLTLEHVRMPWNSGFYRNLSTLTIKGFRLEAVSPLDSDVCYILRDSPQLRVLDLSGQRCLLRSDQPQIIDFPVPPSEQLIPRTEMKHLHTLILTNIPVTQVHRLLSSMKAVNVTHLSIRLSDPVPDAHAALVADLFSMDNLPGGGLLSGMRALAIQPNSGGADPRTYVWARQKRGFAFTQESLESHVEWANHFSEQTHSEICRQIASHLLEHNALDEVEELHLLSGAASSVAEPFLTLLRLPSLKDIILDSGASDALMDKLHSADPDGPGVIIAKKWGSLEGVTIRHCTLADSDLETILELYCRSSPGSSLRKLTFDGVSFNVANPGAMEALLRGFCVVSELDVNWGFSPYVYCSDGQEYQLCRDYDYSDESESRARYNLVGYETRHIAFSLDLDRVG